MPRQTTQHELNHRRVNHGLADGRQLFNLCSSADGESLKPMSAARSSVGAEPRTPITHPFDDLQTQLATLPHVMQPVN